MTEPNNNYMRETEDVSRSTDEVEIDSISVIKVVCNRRPNTSVKELPLEEEEVNSCPRSIAGDASVENLLREIDLMLETMKQDENLISQPTSTTKKNINELEPIQVNNNPREIPEASQIQSTDLVSNISKYKDMECVCRPRGRPRKKQPIKSRKSVVDDDQTSKTCGDTFLDTLSETNIVMLDTEKTDNKPECESETIVEKKLEKLEPIETNKSPEPNIENTSSENSTVQIKSRSKVSKRKATTYTSSRRRMGRSKVTKAKLIVSNNETNIVTSSDSQVEITTASKPKGKFALKHKSTKPEREKQDPVEIMKNIALDINDESLVTEEQEPTLTISDKTKPKIRCIYKARARMPKQLIKSEPTEQIESDLKTETTETLLESEEQSEPVSETPEPNPKNKRGRKPRAAPLKQLLALPSIDQVEIKSECRTTDALSVPEVQGGSICEGFKPKPKCTRKPRVGKPRVGKPNQLIKSEPLDQGETNTGNITLQTRIRNELITGTTNPKPKRIRKSRAKTATSTINSEPINKKKTVFVEQITKSSAQNDSISLSETLKIRDSLCHNSEEKSQEIEPTKDSIELENTRIINDHELSLNDQDLSHSVPKIAENNYPLIDMIKQPKVLLWNIAYSDKITPKQKQILLKNEKSRKCLGTKNFGEQLTNECIESSTSHYIIRPEPPKSNKERTKAVSRKRVCENNHSSTGKSRLQKKRKITTQSKVSALKSCANVYSSKLSVRASEQDSSGTSLTDILSSIGNDVLSIGKECSLKTEKNQRNDFGRKLTESTDVEEEVLMWPQPDTMELEIPLDLSIRESGKSMSSNETDFTKPDENSSTKVCSGRNEHQLPALNVDNVGFGSSTFNVTDLSTSFTEIDNRINCTITKVINNVNGKYDDCANAAAQEYREEISTFYTSLQTTEKKSSTRAKITEVKSEKKQRKVIHIRKARAKAPNELTKSVLIKEAKVEPERKTHEDFDVATEIFPAIPSSSKTKKGSSRHKKLSPRDKSSSKLSLPAEHHLTEQIASHEKSDVLIKSEKLPYGRRQKKSHTKLDEIEDQTNIIVTYPKSNSTEKSGTRNLIITEIRRTVEGNSDQRIELSTPSPDMVTSKDSDADFKKPVKKCNNRSTGINTPSEIISFEPVMNPLISDVRSLPRIITDETFPKGTIMFPSSNANSSMGSMIDKEIGNELSYSENNDEIDLDQRRHQPTILNENTYTAMNNVSRFPTIGHCWSSKNSAAHERDNINVGIDAPNNLGETKNPDNISSEEFRPTMQIDNDDQNSSFIHENFDSTQLWKICPELEEYFSHDDVVNNNNNNKDAGSSNFGTPSNGKSNINSDHETNPESDNPEQFLGSSSNNLGYKREGAKPVNFNYIELENESSDTAVTTHEAPRSINQPVIVNLTAANLRNFDNISNRNGKDGLWADYLFLHGGIQELSNNRPMKDVMESSCEDTEFTLESQKGYPQNENTKRKRKWVKDEEKKTSKPNLGKKIKLNRSRWSEGQDGDNTNNLPKHSFLVSMNSNKSETPSVIEDTQSPKKTCHEKPCNVEDTIKQEPNLAEKVRDSGQSKDSCEPANTILDEKMIKFTETDQKERPENSTFIPSILECGLGSDNRLQAELCVSSPQCTRHYDSDENIDKNGNFTSVSSSSSSASHKSGLTNGSGKSIHSKNSIEENPRKDAPEKTENECQTKVVEEKEYDSDCISLFAESDQFTNFDQATNLTELITLSPLFDCMKETGEKFQEMSNVGVYFDRNVQECNEAYEHCIDPNVVTGDGLINLNQPNLKQSMKSSGRESHPASSSVEYSKPNHKSITNLKNRLGERKETGVCTFSSINSESLFYWHCFQKLQRGTCTRKSCPYIHHLTPKLQNLEQEDMNVIHAVIDYAIYKNYNYFVRHIYPGLLTRMDYTNIIRLFTKLANKNLIVEHIVECTIFAVKTIGISLKEFVSDIAIVIDENNDILGQCILEVISTEIPPGTYWSTFRDLLIRMKPSASSINKVIYDCIHNKDKSEIEDIYLNYVSRFTDEQLLNINVNLRGQFDLLLLENNLIHIDNSSQPPFFINSNPIGRTLEMNLNAENNFKDQIIDIPTILSPDNTTRQSYYENLSQHSPGSRQVNQKLSSQEIAGSQILNKNQDNESNSTPSNHSSFNQRRNSAAQVSPATKQQLLDVNLRMSESDTANSSSNSSYKLYPIDDLQPPQSTYRDRHWRFHLALNNLKVALEHDEYPYALRILDRYSAIEKSLFTTCCYRILCQNVMASAHHVKNMIKLSVRIGVNNLLNETLLNLGLFMMIELCNTNAWVLAYSLYKSLKYSPISTDNSSAFALISAEICLANWRPLKAFDILKQNNMLCANRSRWNVTSNLTDESIRVMIINLLLDVLCEEYPDRAFYIFTYLLKDQSRIYHPVDLTACVDKLVTGILRGKCNDLIIDVGRLIVENNFPLKKSVFRLLVVNVFEKDMALCRQLYHYATWFGVYPIVKSTFPLHLLIKTNWTKEEMYLVIINFLEKLSMEMGPAVDRTGPNLFAIHLVFELAPFTPQLPENNLRVSNKDELKMSKELMRTVLRERFNPPLKTLIAERERFMKLQSRSVVNYLKSMIK